MRKLSYLIAALAIGVSNVGAQERTADPADVATIDALMTAYYEPELLD